jgi:hypothetical protein
MKTVVRTCGCFIGLLLLALAPRATEAQDVVSVLNFSYWSIVDGDVVRRPTVADLKLSTSLLSQMKEVLPCLTFVTRDDIAKKMREGREVALRGGTFDFDEIAKMAGSRYVLWGSVSDNQMMEDRVKPIYNANTKKIEYTSDRVPVPGHKTERFITIDIYDWKKGEVVVHASAPADSIHLILFELNKSDLCPWTGTVTVTKHHTFDHTWKEGLPEVSVPIGQFATGNCFYVRNEDWTDEWQMKVRRKRDRVGFTICEARVSAHGSIAERRTQDVQNIICWNGNDSRFPSSLHYKWELIIIPSGGVDVDDVKVRIVMDDQGKYMLEVRGALAVAPATGTEKEKRETDCESVILKDGAETKSIIGVMGDVFQKLKETKRGIVAVGNIERVANLKTKSLTGEEEWDENDTEDQGTVKKNDFQAAVHVKVSWDLKK